MTARRIGVKESGGYAQGFPQSGWTGPSAARTIGRQFQGNHGHMAAPGFVHLHVHSSYSLLEGALTIGKLAELAKADRQPALALTDSDNMFGALEFSDKLAGAGVQPIIGIALSVDFADQEARNGHGVKLPRVVLLAAREEGYRNLMRLSSRAVLDTPADQPPHVTLAAPAAPARAAGPPPRRRRRADRADRRAERPARSRDRGRSGRACGRALRQAR